MRYDIGDSMANDFAELQAAIWSHFGCDSTHLESVTVKDALSGKDDVVERFSLVGHRVARCCAGPARRTTDSATTFWFQKLN